jgi:hypothetical protein
MAAIGSGNYFVYLDLLSALLKIFLEVLMFCWLSIFKTKEEKPCSVLLSPQKRRLDIDVLIAQEWLKITCRAFSAQME